MTRQRLAPMLRAASIGRKDCAAQPVQPPPSSPRELGQPEARPAPGAFLARPRSLGCAMGIAVDRDSRIV